MRWRKGAGTSQNRGACPLPPHLHPRGAAWRRPHRQCRNQIVAAAGCRSTLTTPTPRRRRLAEATRLRSSPWEDSISVPFHSGTFQIDCRARQAGLAMTNGGRFGSLKCLRPPATPPAIRGPSESPRRRLAEATHLRSSRWEDPISVPFHSGGFQMDCRARQAGLAMTNG